MSRAELACAFGLLALTATACTTRGPDVPGLFILGVDGMDPVISQRLMDEGKLPNLARLAAAGGFQALATINPPQSPVAWSSFVTGLDPGGHGIFDFVHRDPKTYGPISSATSPVTDPAKAIEIGDLYFPIGGGEVGNNRAGVPFWDLLVEAGVDTEIYRIPGNYPVPGSNAKTISGMGTSDMRGGYGVYTWFTDKPVPTRPSGEHIKGDIQIINVDDYDLDGTPDSVHGALKGPPDLFHLAPDAMITDKDYLTAGVTFWLNKGRSEVYIQTGSGSGHHDTAVLKQGEWSDWMKVTYDALPGGMLPFEGMVRFYAKELGPGFAVYASPVNIVPSNPAQPITTPDDWSADLAALLGNFYTQGMPEETNALKDGLFDDDDYLGQVALVREDTRLMTELALARFQRGDMTFMYVSDIDLQCHMLWRHGDPKHADAEAHPAWETGSAEEHRLDIEHMYRHVDALAGRVIDNLPAGSTFLLMSDHGFQPYTREVNLNTWLRDNGYLVLKDGKTTGTIPTDDVDWSKTRAYNIGFNALYLNQIGREGQGIVAAAEADSLMKEIADKLVAQRDPKNGDAVVRSVARSKDIYATQRASEAPDLIVGFDIGYGNSDQSTLGEITAEVYADNTSRWSGNHLMDPDVVPGVLYANQPLPNAAGARVGGQFGLLDITATVLNHFHVAPAPGMTGQSIY
ncbi:MAG: hypothetical protein EXR69_11360 [Myxococcales bacterium]|nr:hypothetical protein [Myxococcales bacterium]